MGASSLPSSSAGLVCEPGESSAIFGQGLLQPPLPSEPPQKHRGFRADIGLESLARRTLGIILLFITVFLWTASNFLASVGVQFVPLYIYPRLTNSTQYIFADNTYSKPYFVTYFNTAFFAISLGPILLRIALQKRLRKPTLSAVLGWQHHQTSSYEEGESARIDSENLPSSRLLQSDLSSDCNYGSPVLGTEETEHSQDVLSIRETAALSFEFCLLWFLANYFVAACLEYTSVASSTILTSTSSIWTLLIGAIIRVESFSMKKLTGVLCSIAGIVLISMIDLSGNNDDHRGSFPHKSQRQIAIGEVTSYLAFFTSFFPTYC